MDGGDGESVVEDEDDVLMGNVHMIYSNLMDGEGRLGGGEEAVGWVGGRRRVGVCDGCYSTAWLDGFIIVSTQKL